MNPFKTDNEKHRGERRVQSAVRGRRGNRGGRTRYEEDPDFIYRVPLTRTTVPSVPFVRQIGMIQEFLTFALVSGFQIYLHLTFLSFHNTVTRQTAKLLRQHEITHEPVIVLTRDFRLDARNILENQSRPPPSRRVSVAGGKEQM